MWFRQLVPGFEAKVPVLFLDLNDDLLTPSDDDPEGAVVTGKLHGEKPETMIDLPIITKEEHIVRQRRLCLELCLTLSLSLSLSRAHTLSFSFSLLQERLLRGTLLFTIRPV